MVILQQTDQFSIYTCRYYDDFHTIDWVRDRDRDRQRHQRLIKNKKLSWKGWAKKLWDAGSGWLIVFLVGVSSGILAGTIVHTRLPWTQYDVLRVHYLKTLCLDCTKLQQSVCCLFVLTLVLAYDVHATN